MSTGADADEIINAAGRRVPGHVPGYGSVRPFAGADPEAVTVMRVGRSVRCAKPGRSKVLPALRVAIEACELRDGATISFHHHLRNGDAVLNQVVAEIARMGLRDIHVAASSIFPVHSPLVEHIRNGVVTGISAPYISGPVAGAISQGLLPSPAVMYTHGGRARAIESGDRHIAACSTCNASTCAPWTPTAAIRRTNRCRPRCTPTRTTAGPS